MGFHSRRPWMMDKKTARLHLFDLMEDVYSYLKYLGYDIKDIATFEQLRQVLSIDSLKGLAAQGGYDEVTGRKRRAKALDKAVKTRTRVADRKKKRRESGYYGSYCDMSHVPTVWDGTDTGFVDGIDNLSNENE